MSNYKCTKIPVVLADFGVFSCFQLTLLVVQVSILYYGGHLVISGQMTSGNLISFIIYEFVLGDCMEVSLFYPSGLPHIKMMFIFQKVPGQSQG